MPNRVHRATPDIPPCVRMRRCWRIWVWSAKKQLFPIMNELDVNWYNIMHVTKQCVDITPLLLVYNASICQWNVSFQFSCCTWPVYCRVCPYSCESTRGVSQSLSFHIPINFGAFQGISTSYYIPSNGFIATSAHANCICAISYPN